MGFRFTLYVFSLLIYPIRYKLSTLVMLTTNLIGKLANSGIGGLTN